MRAQKVTKQLLASSRRPVVRDPKVSGYLRPVVFSVVVLQLKYLGTLQALWATIPGVVASFLLTRGPEWVPSALISSW